MYIEIHEKQITLSLVSAFVGALIISFVVLAAYEEPEPVSTCSSLTDSFTRETGTSDTLEDNYIWYEGKRWILDTLSIDYKDHPDNELEDNHLTLEFIN